MTGRREMKRILGEIVLLHGKTPSSRHKIALYILQKKVALSPSFIKRRGWTVSNQPSPVKNLCIKRIVFRVVVLTAAANQSAGVLENHSYFPIFFEF